MSVINKQDIISDDALEAPLVLRKNFESLLGTAKEFISSAKQYDDNLKSGSKTSEDHRKRTKELSDEQRVLSQITKQVATESAKQSDEYGKLSARLRELKEQTKDRQKMTAEEARLVEASTSSLDRLSQALAKNKQVYASLGTEKERTSASGKRLLKTIQDQDKALQSLHPTVETAQGKIFLLSEALNKMGEGGVRVNEMLLHTGEVLTSGWSLIAGGVGLAAAALKVFFDNTEEGRIKMEIFEEQTITRWAIFKNKVAEATQAVITFAEADEATRKFHEEQRVARMTPEQLKEYQKQQALDKASKDIVLERVKLEKEEANITVERVTKLGEAAKLEIEARESADRGLKERLEAITKADSLYKAVQQEDINIATKRAGLLNSEIYLRAQGRELLVSERLQIQQNIASVIQLQIEFDKASRRRIQLMQSLKKEIAGQKTDVDFSLYEQDWEKMLAQIGKLNTEEERAKKEANDKDLKEQQEHDKAVFESMEQTQELENKAAEKRWEHYKERKKDLAEREVELAKVASNSIVSVVNSQFENQIRAHEFYLAQTRENYQEEMQMAAGNKIAQAQLTSTFREKEKREQQEIIREKRKMAAFDRDTSALFVVLKTAEAVMADVAKYPETAGQPFATYDEAIGAAMLATIIARPLPSYELGTKSHQGGKAQVGEAGFELYSTPQGKLGLTPNETSVIDLPKGTQVIDHDKTIRLLALAGLTNSMVNDRSVSFSEKIVSELQEVKKAIELQGSRKEDFYAMMSGYYKFKKESETFAKKILIEKFGR